MSSGSSSLVRKHPADDEEMQTPSSAPPPNKRCHQPGGEKEEEEDFDEESCLSMPCGATNRRYTFMTIRDIKFAIPEGYDTDPGNIEYLGGGAYGNVIKTSAPCQDGLRRWVAIKKLKEPFHDPFQARRIYREIKLLQLMRHDNIICALDIYTPDEEDNFKDVYVVTEYAGRSIFRILKQQKDHGRKILSPDHVKFVIYQIIRALKYIHSANIIHRDLKPGNLALTNDSDLTVLDFGLARSLDKKETSLTQYVQTRWYRSPEVIYWKIDSYTHQADMWSVGCIAAELLTGDPLFPGDDDSQRTKPVYVMEEGPTAEILLFLNRHKPYIFVQLRPQRLKEMKAVGQ